MSDKEQKKTSSPKKKTIIGIIIGASLVLAITASAAIAVQMLPVKNYFKSADSTPPTVVETFDGELKSNIKIQNDVDYDVYVRAKLVFTLQDAAGNVLGYVPIGIKEGETTGVAEDSYEYTYKLSTATIENSSKYTDATAGQWIYNEVDGFYYYSSPVAGNISSTTAADRQTAVLMDSIKVNDKSKMLTEDEGGYSLHVEVLSQFVQVAGSVDVYDQNGKYDATKEDIPPIEDAWGATINDDLIITALPKATTP